MPLEADLESATAEGKLNEDQQKMYLGVLDKLAAMGLTAQGREDALKLREKIFEGTQKMGEERIKMQGEHNKAMSDLATERLDLARERANAAAERASIAQSTKGPWLPITAPDGTVTYGNPISGKTFGTKPTTKVDPAEVDRLKQERSKVRADKILLRMKIGNANGKMSDLDKVTMSDLDKRDAQLTSQLGSAGAKGTTKVSTPRSSITAKSSGPKRISSAAEYQALPGGTVFVDPKGNTRRKP
jgi:hypothetical protein